MTRMQQIKTSIGENNALISAMSTPKFQCRVMQ